MIQKYIYGDPIETDTVIKEIPTSEGHPSYGTISTQDGFSFTYIMQPEDIGWASPTAASTSEASFMSATAQTSPTIRRTSSPFTAPITLSLLTESITVLVFLLTTRPI